MAGPGDDIFKKIASATQEDTHGVDTGTSLSGLGAGGSYDVRAIPKYYEKIGKKLGWSPFDLPENMERIAYINQPISEQIGNMVKGGFHQAVSGFTDALASWDLQGVSDMALGNTEAKYGNWLNEITKDYRDWTNNNFQIYTDGDRMDNLSYWLKQGQNIGYTGGIIAETIAEQAALSYLTGGTANELGLSKNLNLIKNAGQASWGMWKGVQEGYMNGLETQNQVYNKYKNLGYSEDEAKQRAAEAATLGYRMEVGPLAALNALQFATIGKYNPFSKGGVESGFSGAFESITDKLIPNIKNKFVKGAVGYGMNMASEGFEEGVQTAASKYAQYNIDEKNNQTNGKTVGDYIWDSEMRDSIIGGAIGGSMFKGAFDGYNYLTKGTEAKKYSQAHDSFIEASQERVKNDLSNLQKAFESGDKTAIAKQRAIINKNNTLSALRLDFINNKETAFESHIEQMQNVLDAIDNQDIQSLRAYGIENEKDVAYIKDSFPKYIADATQIKNNLINNLGKSVSYDVAEKLTFQEHDFNMLRELQNTNNAELEQFKTKDSQYQSLSNTGKEFTNMNAEYKALSLHNPNSLTESQKERKAELKEKLSNFKTENKDVLKNEDYIYNSLDQDNYVNAQYTNQRLEQQMQSTSKDIAYWRNIENQRKEVAKRTQEKLDKKVNSITSSEELKKTKQDAEVNGVLDKASEEKINDKIEQAEVRESSTNQLTEDTPPVMEEMPVTSPSTERAQMIGEVSNAIQKDNILPEDVVNMEELFEPLVVSDSHSEMLQNKVQGAFQSIEMELGRIPTFKEFVQDTIQNIGKQNTEKIFNGLVKGWQLNNYKNENFNQIYTDLFIDRKQNYLDILQNLEESIPQNIQQVESNNVESLTKAVEEKAQVIAVDNNTNRPILEDTNPFKTSDSNLRASYLSVGYTRKIDDNGVITEEDTSEELYESTDIKSKKLLDPDSFNEGTELTVKVPENFNDIIVSTWQDDVTRGKSMPFEKWVRDNNIIVGSDEYIAKIPMIAYDKANDGVFFIHDTQWYNPINIGLKDNPQEQIKTIFEGRENTLNFRKEVYANNGQVVQITKKRPGTWKTISKDQPAITINQANPQSILGTANDLGEIVVNGKVFEDGTKKLIGTAQFKRGNTYDIRKSTNSNEYIAFEVLRDKISNETANTIKQAARVYLLQYDNENKQIQNIRQQVSTLTGYDLFNRDDFEKFLQLHIQTLSRPFASMSDIQNYMNAYSTVNKEGVRNLLPDGTPYFALQKGNLVFGSVRTPMSGKNELLYLHPAKAKDEGGIDQINSMLIEFDKLVGNVTQNISKQGLELNRNLVQINEQGEVLPIGNYENYLKDSLRTSVKSFNIGTKETPNFITIIQPVIEFEKKGAIKQETVPEVVEYSQVNEIEPQEITESNIDRQLLIDSLQQLRELGIDENDPSMLFLKEQLGEESLFEPVSYTDEQVADMKETTTGVEGLSIIQDFQLVDYIFNQISAKINFKKGSSVNRQDLLSGIRESYNTIIEPKQNKNKELIANLTKVYESNPSVNTNIKTLIDTLEREGKIFEDIKNRWSQLELKALDKLFKYTGIKENEEVIDEISDEDSETEKNYSKISLEENGKETASYRLKRFFSSVQQTKPNGEAKTGFLGIPTYVGFDTVYSTIEQVISSPYEVESDFDLMVARLEDNVVNYPWLRQVIDNIKLADLQIKNEFVYNFARHTLSMKFIMFSQNRDESWTLKVYDTNANEITRVIREQWKSNFRNTPLTYIENGEYKVNKERAKYLLSQFEGWRQELDAQNSRGAKTLSVSNKELQDWLGNFGIYLSDESLNEMKTKQIEYNTNDGKKKIRFDQYFEKSPNTAGIFGLLADYLEGIIQTSNTEFEENENNHPFKNANNVLKTLAKIESKYSLFATTNSFRDGDKSIYGFTPTKYATDAVNKLKFDPSYRAQLMSKSFNKHSYILDLLNRDESFQEKFYIDHIGITSLKELGKKVYGNNNDITSLSNSDHELTKLGLFQDTEQGEVGKYLGDNNFIKLRMARMFFPTMSDKSQMLDLFTAVMDLRNKHFNEDLSIKDELKEVIYSQVVKPELERLHKFNSQIGETNIDGYDVGAQMFLMIPEINNLVDPITNKRAISLMANNPAEYTIEWFEDTFKAGKIFDILENQIQTKANKKVEEWRTSGFIDENNNIKYLNNKYFNKFEGDSAKKIKLAALDYIINSQVTNANVFMTIAGDLAMYSQEKIKKFFQNGKAYLPKTEEQGGYGDKVYSKIAKDVLGVNLGKRLALLLAPGSKLANSKDAEYIQVFLEDSVDMTSNALYLIDMFYGKEQASLSRPLVNEYFKTDNQTRRKAIVDELSSAYPDIADYFEIELTDAQEMTTLSEHINVLLGQGRLSQEQYDIVQSKIQDQLQAEAQGKSIPKSAMLNYSELKLVLQPIKPVHTGFLNDEKFDTMRMMYIKTSSFPLIPQITKGTELDGLRQLLEKAEAKSGKSVRASYQTGNKVGANKKALTVFNSTGSFNSELIKDLDNNQFDNSLIGSASLILNRDNFRIQQDVPFKSAKREEDVISLGTQTLKLLFGDGILNINGFELEGENLSGADLHKEYNTAYDSYISLRKNMLYKQLGVDENGRPLNVEKSMNMLQDLLKREAVSRGYPKQDIEALKVIPKLDESGNVINIDFSIPLWLSPNSNRYEALLNAIVSNKLAKIKLPGNSYVVGSEAGFKMKSDLEGIEQSRIIFTSKWEGELKAAEISGGKLKKAQVLLPSKFRDNEGKLIQLIDKEGNPNTKYVERDEQGMLRLKEDMINEELLNLTSFRIPTSSHVSMAQVEIVGILPTEAGDLMIVPKNMTKQKGLDFDIDKENTYQLWTYIDAEGGIRTLDEEGKKYLLNKADTLTYEMLNSDNSMSRLMRAMFGDDLNFTEDDFKNDKVLDKLNDKLNQKLYENRIVKIHTSVLSNANPEVQRKINKVLSMDFAKSQAQLIDNKINGNQNISDFSILDDTYQKDKMFLGASGKMGIGVYSNYVVFHSMIQQSDKPLTLLTKDEDDNLTNLEIRIGNFTSKGKLGGSSTLDGSRSISEVFAERQNTATDNEKEQVMGRVNINEITINVDSLLSALGFDKDKLADGKEVSIPYLLLSQPIIRDLVEGLRKTKSNTSEFDPNSKQKVIDELRLKYQVNIELDTTQVERMLTGQQLFDNLNHPNNVIQLAVLDKFLLLDDYAKQIGTVQNRLNINRTGLGKSFFDTLDKYKNIQSLKNLDSVIGNVSNLVGDYIEIDEDITKEVINTYKDEGYLEIGRYLIKPNNPVGSMLVNTVKSGYDLWKDYFPYNDNNVSTVTNEILKMISNENASSQKVVELQQNIFREMKKYFYSSQVLGVFQGNPQVERTRLFIDTTNGKKSLATYLRDILLTKDDKNINEVLKSNKLISRLQYDIQKNGLPSTIKFDNSKGESFDEDYLYNALIELMDENRTLPSFNGEDYSTRKLASDLVAYSFLEGGIQEAVQFSKYIPISLLNTTNFGNSTRLWNSNYIPGIFGALLGVSPTVSKFTRQYAQHNPQRLPKVTTENMLKTDSNNLSNLSYFELDMSSFSDIELDKIEKTNFVSIYNKDIKKGFNKFQVYEKSGLGFKRIDSLGVFGLSEYSIKDENVQSIINPNNSRIEQFSPVIAEKEEMSDTFNINGGSLVEIIDNIENYNFTDMPQLKNVASAIKNYIPNDVSVSVEPLVNINGKRVGNGAYSPSGRKITMDNTYVNQKNKELLAKSFLHETIHALTYDYIDTYVESNGDLKTQNAPKEILNLVLLFNETRRKLGVENVEKVSQKFNDIKSGKLNTGLSVGEATVLYGATDIKEFVTLAMVEPNFQKELSKIEYKETGKTLLDKFFEIVNDILIKVLGQDYQRNSLSSQAIASVLDIIEKQSQNKGLITKADIMNQSDTATENLLNDDIVPKNLDKPNREEEALEPVLTEEDINNIPTC